MGINTCIHYGEYACLSSIDPQFSISKLMYITPQIAKFMWPTLDPPGSCRPRWAPCLFPWALLSGTDLSGSGIDSPLIFSCAGRIKWHVITHRCLINGGLVIPSLMLGMDESFCLKAHHHTGNGVFLIPILLISGMSKAAYISRCHAYGYMGVKRIWRK